MPVNYARRLVGVQRTVEANRTLGVLLAAVAGAINAGGFLATHQYTSHMTGIVSAVADSVALGQFELVAYGLLAVLSFLAGAVCCAWLSNYARRNALSSVYALPLLLEAGLILLFGLLGARLAAMQLVLIPYTVALLCFIMGLQNAVVTKLSNAVIRTTHMTGIVTDLGIELGRLLYWNDPALQTPEVRADRQRMRVLASLLGAFVGGGIVGALAFKQIGYQFTVPIALTLAAVAAVPLWDDLRRPAR